MRKIDSLGGKLKLRHQESQHCHAMSKKKQKKTPAACKIILDEKAFQSSVFTKTDPLFLHSFHLCKKLRFALYVFFTAWEKAYASAEFLAYRRLDIYIIKLIYSYMSLKGDN